MAVFCTLLGEYFLQAWNTRIMYFIATIKQYKIKSNVQPVEISFNTFILSLRN